MVASVVFANVLKTRKKDTTKFTTFIVTFWTFLFFSSLIFLVYFFLWFLHNFKENLLFSLN